MSIPSSSASVATTASSSPSESRCLDLAPLLGGVAAAVGRDPRRQLRLAARLQRFAGEALDQLDPAAALEEADRPHAVGDQLGEQVRGLAQGRAPRPGRLVDQRRVPHRDLAPGAGGAVVVDQLERRSDQLLGQPDRVGDRRRGEQEARLGAVGPRDPPQPPQHVGDVGAEDAAVGVGLVDDDPAEVGEEVAPALVVGQDADVQHVRVGEDEVAAAADRGALFARRVAVVDRLAQAGRAQRAQLARLVLGQRLGRIEVEGAALGVAGDPVEHRQVEGEALARGGAAGDHQVRGGSRLQRLTLVRVEALDPGPLQRLGEAGVERARQRHRPRLAPLLARLGDDPPVTARRLERNRPRRLQQALRHHETPRRRDEILGIAEDFVPSAPGRARRPATLHRLQRAAVVDAEDVGAAAHRQRNRGDRPPLALARRQSLLPRPGQDRADEVLARERDVERQPERAQLGKPAQNLQVLLGRQVEVESGVDGDLLLTHPKPLSGLDSPPQPGLHLLDHVVVATRRPVDPRRSLDVHQHVAAPRLRHQLEHLLATAGDVVDGNRPGRESRPRHLNRKGVGRDRHTRPGQSFNRRNQRRRLHLRRNRRPAFRSDSPHIQHVEPSLNKRQAILNCPLRRNASSPLEHRVGSHVDDPRSNRLRKLQPPTGQSPDHRTPRAGSL